MYKKILKPIFINLIILLFFVILIEIFFGYWFDKNNLGPYMREHRMKNQPTLFNYNGKTIKYNYLRNYYGFTGEDIEPSDIKAVIMGGSVIDERYKPEEFTITGYLNEKLRNNNYNFKIINAGIEGQSTVGMIYNFRTWFPKLKDFKPKVILFYIGLNDLGLIENNVSNNIGDGHVKNPEGFEQFLDNIKSRSFIYDSIRIFKFKYLPRKNFIKYDGNVDPDLENNFKYISYNLALNKYNTTELNIENKKVIKSYLSRVDILHDEAIKLKSTPIFITNIVSRGHVEEMFILNHSLIEHCEIKKYKCIDMAKNLDGKYNYWQGDSHTSKDGSEKIAEIIMQDLPNYLKDMKW